MKKILVPIDFSDTSGHAKNFAKELSDLLEAEIILLHVLEFPSGGFPTMGEAGGGQGSEIFFQGEYIKAVHRQLEQWKTSLEEQGATVTPMVKMGQTFQKIGEAIAETKADIIVMGSKGASGLREIFIGSNAARVVRHASCPVIIVKGETHIKNFKNLVFATDGSEEQDAIVNQVKDVQSLLGLNLHLVKVKTPYNFLGEAAAIYHLDDFVKRNQFEDVTIDSVEANFVDEGAVHFAEQNDAGMVLIGTHGRTGLSHLVGGSIAESIVNESEIPVMVMRL